MTRGKASEWIEAAEASRIMSEKHGRTISTDYVRVLGKLGHLRHKLKDKRSKLYLKSDVEAYHVREKHEKHRKSSQEEGSVP